MNNKCNKSMIWFYGIKPLSTIFQLYRSMIWNTEIQNNFSTTVKAVLKGHL